MRVVRLPVDRRCLAVGLALAFVCLFGNTAAAQGLRYEMAGIVVSIAADRSSVVVSHDAVPGVMPAMAMPFDVRDPGELAGVAPGAAVAFTLVLDKESAYAERLRVVPYQSVEQDPLRATRLAMPKMMSRRKTSPRVTAGQPVPDFTLTDHTRATVSLSDLRGKVVAVNFIYTSCALPQFCYRMANHFAAVERRFRAAAGRDLVLLTVTFDPARDTPEQLAEYARQWNVAPRAWHFLTGGTADVQRVSEMFGLESFPDEGLIVHLLRTAIIDRRGRLVASLEGNRFSAAQLGDLIESVLAP